VRKRMSTVNAAPGGGGRGWVKGAPESLIPLCSTITGWNGERRPFTPGEQTKILQTLNEFAQGGLRVLALAWKEGGSPEATQFPGGRRSLLSGHRRDDGSPPAGSAGRH
jgi:magnesium-transporting ATPase (P-type)